ASCTELEEKDPPPKIGEVHEGGVVTHLFTSSQPGYVKGEVHGIIVSEADLTLESQWGCRGTEVTGTSPAVGRGRSNTELVLAFHDNLPDYYNNPTQCHELNDGTVAVNFAREFNLNGYDDWFMPSQKEMKLLYDRREEIGGFVEEEYWSSCESNATNACVVSFVTGEILSAEKSETKKVRVIRYF
ncbi:MAG: DUF1566 domain-containing protein, partial [Cyclobacteriaceae bacterium]